MPHAKMNSKQTKPDATRPSPEDARRCFELRKRSKRGEQPSQEDSRFLETMYKRHTDWYRSLDAQVFNETVPFGSHAKYR